MILKMRLWCICSAVGMLVGCGGGGPGQSDVTQTVVQGGDTLAKAIEDKDINTLREIAKSELQRYENVESNLRGIIFALGELGTEEDIKWMFPMAADFSRISRRFSATESDSGLYGGIRLALKDIVLRVGQPAFDQLVVSLDVQNPDVSESAAIVVMDTLKLADSYGDSKIQSLALERLCKLAEPDAAKRQDVMSHAKESLMLIRRGLKKADLLFKLLQSSDAACVVCGVWMLSQQYEKWDAGDKNKILKAFQSMAADQKLDPKVKTEVEAALRTIQKQE